MNPVIPAAVACAIGLAQAPASGATLEVHTTASGTDQRLALARTTTFVPGKQPPEGDISVFVDRSKTYQTMLGIGGAITDASAEVFAKLAPKEQQQGEAKKVHGGRLGKGTAWAFVPSAVARAFAPAT